MRSQPQTQWSGQDNCSVFFLFYLMNLLLKLIACTVRIFDLLLLLFRYTRHYKEVSRSVSLHSKNLPLTWCNVILLKLIFHCNGKQFALGHGVGLDPQRHNFALGIPTCWYLKTLKFVLPPKAKYIIYVTLNAKPKCKPMEYRLHWVPNTTFLQWPCTFDVVCAHFICVGYPTRTKFAVERGILLKDTIQFL